jgi:hypothetical protein
MHVNSDIVPANIFPHLPYALHPTSHRTDQRHEMLNRASIRKMDGIG